MSYLSSNDARRQDSDGLVEGFSTPAQELFLCTCHQKRWPLSMLRMENNGQRHCPNQANPQGGSIDRDALRDYDRVELERRAVEDATPVQWPISPLENIPCVWALTPAQQTVRIGGQAVVLITGANLSASDTIVFSLAAVTVASAVYASDGSLCTLTVNGVGPAGDVNVFYNGSEYDAVFQVR